MRLKHGADQPCGYISFDDTNEHTTVAEVGYATSDVFESMVALIAQRASKYGHEDAYLTAPPDHPFAIYLRRYGCFVRQNFSKSGNGMMRIINVESLFVKIADELSRRLRRSALRESSIQYKSSIYHLDDESSIQYKSSIYGTGSSRLLGDKWHGTFAIVTDIGAVQVNIEADQVHVEPLAHNWRHDKLEIPQCKLIQLVVGYRDIATVALDDDVSLTPALIPLMDALFPLSAPYIWWSDRF